MARFIFLLSASASHKITRPTFLIPSQINHCRKVIIVIVSLVIQNDDNRVIIKKDMMMIFIKRYSLCLAITMLAVTTSFAANQEVAGKTERGLDDDRETWSDILDISNTAVNASNTTLWQGEEHGPQIQNTPTVDKQFNVWENSDESDGENNLYPTGISHVNGGSSISGWILIALVALGLINILGKKSKK